MTTYFDFIFRETTAENGKVLNNNQTPTQDIHLTKGLGKSEGVVLISPAGGLYIPNTYDERAKQVDLLNQQIEIENKIVENDINNVNINKTQLDYINKLLEEMTNALQSIAQGVMQDPVAGNGAPWGSPTITSGISQAVGKLTGLKTQFTEQVNNDITNVNNGYDSNKQDLEELKNNFDEFKKELV